MREVRVTLETVTPLFLGGADPRGAPELRPPAFRGALRYWLRAALGGVIGDKNLDGLHQLESAVFGSTDESSGGASAVIVRIANEQLSEPQTYARLRPPTGRDYLYWSMAESGKADKRQPPKQFYAPGGSFDIVLSVRPGVFDGERVLRQATAAFWLLVNLGGLGSRARRTAGSLAITQPHSAMGLNFDLSAKTPQEAAQRLGAGLTAIRQALDLPETIDVHSPSDFDVLHPRTCKVWVLGIWPKAEMAVECIGTALRDFRSRREPDHQNVAKWLHGQRIPTVERAVFGLPIPYRYSDGGPTGTVQGETVDRRASPLWLKISKTSHGSYIGVATLFESVFLPNNEGLRVKTRNGTPIINQPHDYTLIDRWIAASFPNQQEVRYV